MTYFYFLFSFWFLQKKDFLVVNKPVNVYGQSLGRMLRQGDWLLQKDSVRFSSSSGVLVMAGPFGVVKKGPSSSEAKRNDRSSALWATLTDVVLPEKSKGVMMARGGILSGLMEAEAYFKRFNNEMNALLVIDTLHIPVSTAIIADTSLQYFYLSYIYKNETINKKIPVVKNGINHYLKLDEKLFFIDGKYSGQDLIGPAELHFYNGKKGTSTSLSSFFIRHVRFKTLHTELCLISQAMSFDMGKMDETQFRHITDYIMSFYGQIDVQDFKNNYSPLLNCIVSK